MMIIIPLILFIDLSEYYGNLHNSQTINPICMKFGGLTDYTWKIDW